MAINESQFPPRPTSLAHEMLGPMIRAGDRVIDATAGNGYDTVFLAKAVGALGRVLAFDVQESALKSAQLLATEMNLTDRVEFIHASHALMERYADVESIRVVMFNLGYLPGDEHEITTLAVETLLALEASARVLKSGGILSVICYPGHTAGSVEAGQVEAWMTARVPEGWRVSKYAALGTRRPAPFLLLAAKP